MPHPHPQPLVPFQCLGIGRPGVAAVGWGLCSGSHKTDTEMPPELCPRPKRDPRQAPWLQPVLTHSHAERCVGHTCVLARSAMRLSPKNDWPSPLQSSGSGGCRIRSVSSPEAVLRVFVLGVFSKLLLCVLSGSKMHMLWPRRDLHFGASRLASSEEETPPQLRRNWGCCKT